MILERLPQSSREVVRYPRNQDLTAWRRGMYHLSKNPQGLTQQRAADSRLVYIDPGTVINVLIVTLL